MIHKSQNVNSVGY